MTRKEEREQAAKNYWDESKYKSDLSGFPIEAFKAGAAWADRTMLDKACEWLDRYFENKVFKTQRELIINDFKKYMEE